MHPPLTPRTTSALTAAAVVLLALAGLPAAAADSPQPTAVKIAVFEFELEDLSPAAVLQDKTTSSAATMDKVSSAARRELAQSGRYDIVDVTNVDAAAAKGKSLRDCDGCEAGIALHAGAEQSLIGLVRRVTQTDYYVVIRIRDARTGKILDQEEANFAGSEEGWASGVRMLIRHQVLPAKE